MYFWHRTTNTATNRVQIDYLKYVLRAFMLTDCNLNTSCTDSFKVPMTDSFEGKWNMFSLLIMLQKKW